MRLRDWHEFLVFHCFVDLFGNERLQNFALDIFSEAPANQSDRGLAGAKSGYSGHARELARRALDSLLHVFGGDFQFQFAPTSCLRHVYRSFYRACITLEAAAGSGESSPAGSRSTVAP